MTDFEGRLENWGMLYHDQRGGGSTSTTYEVCRRMAVERGAQIRDGYRTVEAAAEIDEDDARIIEWCWCQSSFRMDKKHWALLRAHYVERSDPRFICRVLKIRWRSFESERVAAVRRFEYLVQLLENYGKTPSK